MNQVDLEGLERLAKAVEVLLPVTRHDTPDYAEINFGTAKSQTMTMEPETFLALNVLSALLASHEAAQAEVKRLREALKRIASQKQTCASDEVETWELQDIARAALKETLHAD